MFSIHQAKQIILDHTLTIESTSISIQEALNFTTSFDILSPIDLPPFPQSSMDGYAFLFKSLHTHTCLDIKHKIAAGDESTYLIKESEAVRIFTGAPIPHGADTVVMQEKTEIKDGKLYILDTGLTSGSNYRNQGSEINLNALALPKGARLTPAAIGFLASMGIRTVEVYRRPKVCILVTGDELASLGQKLNYGKVYDSNSYTLSSAIKQAGIDAIDIRHIPDQIESLKQALMSALDQNDIVILTGGVSVGDFDFVTQAAEAVGVNTLFHKIKQKPGKPMYCGKKEHRFVFGLPGNPASALTCFYEYLEPALKKMMGQKSSIQIINVPITAQYKKPVGLTHFLKANYDGHRVTPLDAQESFRLKSFAQANALIVVGEDETEIKLNQEVEVHLLP